MTWHDAMERFGSDKPDTRFGMELVELTPIFAETQARVFQAPCVKGICLAGGAETLPRSRVDELVATCQQLGSQGPGLDEGRGRGSRRLSPRRRGGQVPFAR